MMWKTRKRDVETGARRLRHRFAWRPKAIDGGSTIWLGRYWHLEEYDYASGGWFTRYARVNCPFDLKAFEEPVAGPPT